MGTRALHTAVSLLVLLPGLVFAAGEVPAATPSQAADVSVTDSGPSGESSRYREHEGHKYERRTLTLESGDAHYGILYRACVDPTHGDRVGVIEGYVGMPAPTACNWYWGGFLRILLNKEDVGTYRLADMRVTDRDERGGGELIWDTPAALVRLRFLLEPGANHLKTEILWQPKVKIEQAELTLSCFPSFFTSSQKRAGARHVLTPRVDKAQGETLEIVPDADTFLFYGDRVFDVAKGEGAGPCAMVFLPEAVSGGQVRIGDYAVSTTLVLRPETGRVRLAFWEFPGVTNAAALAWLQENAGRGRQDLAAVDFHPRALATAPDRVAEAARLLEQAGDAGRPFRRQTEETMARIEALSATGATGDWRLEGELLKALPGLDRILWDLRIQALLASGDAK